MLLMDYLAVACVSSALTGLAWYFYEQSSLKKLLFEHKTALEAAVKTPPLSVSAEEILHDLTCGQSLVRIERINPGNVLLRSPRS